MRCAEVARRFTDLVAEIGRLEAKFRGNCFVDTGGRLLNRRKRDVARADFGLL